MNEQAVRVELFRWAGSWGPFNIRIPCGECTLTLGVIEDTLKEELAGIPVDLQVYDWLDYWWRPLLKGGWHAPIVLVEGRLVSQGAALNRGLLTEGVIKVYAQRSNLVGNHLFGKESCPHCQQANGYFAERQIAFQYHDVIKTPRALYEMLARVKPLVGPKTPITVPQIWRDGVYIGGADQLLLTLQGSDREISGE